MSTCLHCHTTFTPSASRLQFCSASCHVAYAAAHKARCACCGTETATPFTLALWDGAPSVSRPSEQVPICATCHEALAGRANNRTLRGLDMIARHYRKRHLLPDTALAWNLEHFKAFRVLRIATALGGAHDWHAIGAAKLVALRALQQRLAANMQRCPVCFRSSRACQGHDANDVTYCACCGAESVELQSYEAHTPDSTEMHHVAICATCFSHLADTTGNDECSE